MGHHTANMGVKKKKRKKEKERERETKNCTPNKIIQKYVFFFDIDED